MKLVYNDNPIEHVEIFSDYNDGGKQDKGKIFKDTKIAAIDLDDCNNLAKYLFIPDMHCVGGDNAIAFVKGLSTQPIRVYAGDKNNIEYNYDGEKLYYHVIVNKDNKYFDKMMSHIRKSHLYMKDYVSGDYPDDFVVVVIKCASYMRPKRYFNGELPELFKESDYYALTFFPILLKSYFTYNDKNNTFSPNKYGCHLLGLTNDYSEGDSILKSLYPQNDAPADIIKSLRDKYGNPFKLEYLND